MNKKEMSKESNKEEANEPIKEEVKSAPDMVGYWLEEACSLLEQAGFKVAVVATGSPRPYPARVLRQRLLHEDLIELTKADELYLDPSSDEKEVRDDALQDN
jgi:hypothetical protein